MKQRDVTDPQNALFHACHASLPQGLPAAHPHGELAEPSSFSNQALAQEPSAKKDGKLSLLVDAGSCKDELEAAMVLLGRGSVENLRALGVRCSAHDLSQVALALHKLELSASHATFEVQAPFAALTSYVVSAAQRWPKLVCQALDFLCQQGNTLRAGWIINETLGVVDASDIVARYPFELINSGWLELVETVVLDETFGVQPALRELVRALRKTLWAPADKLIKRARRLKTQAQAGLRDKSAGARASLEKSCDRSLWLQAKAVGDFFCAWQDPAHEPSQWLASVPPDALTHAFEALRRGRWLLVRGRIPEAVQLVDAHQGSVSQHSVAGSLLVMERLLGSLLLGAPYDATAKGLFQSAASWCAQAGLLVLEQAVRGFGYAVLGFIGQKRDTTDMRVLVDRLRDYPDPLLEVCLHVGLGAMYYRARSFYAALSHVRGLAEQCIQLGATDLAHCAYVLEVLCQGIVGEEPALPPRYRPEHPAALGLYPLVRLAHGVATNTYEIIENVDPAGLRDLFTMSEPTFVAKALADIALSGTWPEAMVMQRVLPDAWLLHKEPTLVPTLSKRALWSGSTAGAQDLSQNAAPQGASPLALAPHAAAPAPSNDPAQSLGEERPNGAQPLESSASSQKANDKGSLKALLAAPPRDESLSALPQGAPHEEHGVVSLVSLSSVEQSWSLADPNPSKLEICLLGDFEVRLGGRKIEESRWQRKAGKILLAALAIAPNHMRTRAELCELLWPDRDYLLSRNSLYAVLSSLRDTLGCKHDEPRYLVGGQGKLGLNPYLVVCDLDIFTERCHEVLSHQGDAFYRLSLCRHLGRFYAGGLAMLAGDVHGDFLACRETLEQLYVDMLVEAADLSLKAGLAKEALWFAKDARAKGSLREDVIASYLRALAVEGRSAELEKAFQEYCNELSQGLMMAPSARMRALFSELKHVASREGDPAA